MKNLWRSARRLFDCRPRGLWECVCTGHVEDQDLERRDGRAVVRGLRSPRPELHGEVDVGGISFATMPGRPSLAGTAWKGLHFLECDFEELALAGARVESCVFEDVTWRGGRFDKCAFEGCTFDRTTLGSAFLGKGGDTGTTYRRVDFRKVDLGASAVGDATFEDCSFVDCRFEGVRFATTRFRRCRFLGTMRDVRFEREAWNRGEQGALEDVDFRGASFVSDVGFVGYDIDRVRLPDGPDHLRVDDYRRRLARIVDEHGTRTDAFSKPVRAYFGGCLAWAGPRQEQGVFCREELVEVWGERDAARVTALLESEA